MWEQFSKLRDETLIKLDTKRLELRISGYSKELNQMYVALGEIYYNAQKNKSKIDDARINELLEGIDSIKQRIKYLGKHISEKKNKSDTSVEQKSPSESKDHKSYAKLKRNQDDLIMKRTVDGIKFFRLCPKCDTQNNAEWLACNNCDFDFSEKKIDENYS